MTDTGAWTVAWRPVPDPIPLNEPFELQVRVTPTGGDAPAAPTVTVDAGMPAHGHGMNWVPQTEPTADGTWRTVGMLFHMPGRWELRVDVEAGSARHRATFEVDVQ